jgi:hypothetical protein
MSREDVKWLRSTPSGDGNFKSHLKTASVGEIRQLILEISGDPYVESRLRALEAELRRREREGCADALPMPGDNVKNTGRQMSFDEVAASVGKLIVMDESTESHAWYKVVLVEKIIPYEGRRRLVYYDGKKQRGYVSEREFENGWPIPARAYRLGRDEK